MLKSSTTTKTHFNHAGRMIEMGYMEPHGISIYRLAQLIQVPYVRAYRVIKGEAPVDSDFDTRLTTLWGAPSGLFMRWQIGYDRRRGIVPKKILASIAKNGREFLKAA